MILELTKKNETKQAVVTRISSPCAMEVETRGYPWLTGQVSSVPSQCETLSRRARNGLTPTADLGLHMSSYMHTLGGLSCWEEAPLDPSSSLSLGSHSGQPGQVLCCPLLSVICESQSLSLGYCPTAQNRQALGAQ